MNLLVFINNFVTEVKRILHNILLLFYYRPWGRVVTPMIICLIDGKVHHGGLADRIKNILGVYAFCKINGYKFGLIANSPFELSDYLKPNYDWRVTEQNFSRNIFWAGPVFIGDTSLDKQKKLLRLKYRQKHVYASTKCYGFIQEGGFNAGKLFNELFVPIPEIVEFINKHKLQFKSWDCLVFRFQNLLGDFNEPTKYQFKKVKMTDYEREQLLEKCYQYTIDESFRTNNYLLVCSDSILFLKKSSAISNIIIVPGELTHMGFTSRNDFKLHLKSFLDFFMISESESIRSVTTSIMYPSGFPSFAAEIRGVKFERVVLK